MLKTFFDGGPGGRRAGGGEVGGRGRRSHRGVLGAEPPAGGVGGRADGGGGRHVFLMHVSFDARIICMRISCLV